jgi:hypothetical protein
MPRPIRRRRPGPWDRPVPVSSEDRLVAWGVYVGGLATTVFWLIVLALQHVIDNAF